MYYVSDSTSLNEKWKHLMLHHPILYSFEFFGLKEWFRIGLCRRIIPKEVFYRPSVPPVSSWALSGWLKGFFYGSRRLAGGPGASTRNSRVLKGLLGLLRESSVSRGTEPDINVGIPRVRERAASRSFPSPYPRLSVIFWTFRHRRSRGSPDTGTFIGGVLHLTHPSFSTSEGGVPTALAELPNRQIQG